MGAGGGLSSKMVGSVHRSWGGVCRVGAGAGPSLLLVGGGGGSCSPLVWGHGGPCLLFIGGCRCS